MKTQIMIVEPREEQFQILTDTIANEHTQIRRATNGRQALFLLKNDDFDVAIVHKDLPDIDGLKILQIIQSTKHATETIISSGQKGTDTMIESLRLGAVDHISDPLDAKSIQIAFRRANERRQLSLNTEAIPAPQHPLQGASLAMSEIRDQIQYSAPFKTTVLVTGESGTGKELAARALHDLGPRADCPFIAINCSTIPQDLAESHLFGHIKGSFTSATTTQQGVFQAANRGTLFLDEIGDLALPAQAKLLRALENQQMVPIGSTDAINVDVRLIAATNRDLKNAVADGTFREDLYYRLNVLHIDMPPLRLRTEDISPLTDIFLQNFATDNNIPPKMLDPDTLLTLLAYPWPGNVRELKNLLERLTVTIQTNTIFPDDLPPDIQAAILESQNGVPIDLSIFEGLSLGDIEKLIIHHTLDKENGNRTHAAKKLGISLRTLQRKLREYDTSVDLDTAAT